MSLKYIKNGIFFFSKLLLAALFIFAVFTEIALSEDMNDVLRIRWVIDEAMRSNPELQSARLSWDAAKERVPQVSALDDPNLGFTYYGEQTQTRVGEVQAGFIASQKIPFYGKLRLRGEVAENEANAVGERYRALERDKSAYKLAKKQYFPDFTFGFNYNLINDLPTSVLSSPVGESRDSYTGTLSINIPIFQKRKYDAGVREANARLKSSERAYRNVENETLFGVKDFHFRMQTSERLVKLYKDSIIPQAQQSLKAAEIGYQAGRVDFLNLIESQRTLLDFQLAYYRAIADFGTNFSELERVVGIELSKKP